MIETSIGRTITGIEPPSTENGWQWLLRLDDGTAVEFAVTDYGDEITVEHLTPEVLRQREADAEAERLARWEARQRTLEVNERKRVHIAEMRSQLTPKAFEKWRRETYPTMTETLKDVWTAPKIQKQFESSSLLR
jgi:hypothetical protein